MQNNMSLHLLRYLQIVSRLRLSRTNAGGPFSLFLRGFVANGAGLPLQTPCLGGHTSLLKTRQDEEQIILEPAQKGKSLLNLEAMENVSITERHCDPCRCH